MFAQKYIKYKNKYLSLKKLIQKGGAWIGDTIIAIKTNQIIGEIVDEAIILESNFWIVRTDNPDFNLDNPTIDENVLKDDEGVYWSVLTTQPTKTTKTKEINPVLQLVSSENGIFPTNISGYLDLWVKCAHLLNKTINNIYTSDR